MYSICLQFVFLLPLVLPSRPFPRLCRREPRPCPVYLSLPFPLVPLLVQPHPPMELPSRTMCYQVPVIPWRSMFLHAALTLLALTNNAIQAAPQHGGLHVPAPTRGACTCTCTRSPAQNPFPRQKPMPPNYLVHSFCFPWPSPHSLKLPLLLLGKKRKSFHQIYPASLVSRAVAVHLPVFVTPVLLPW
ncbi:hypothetical protein V8C42DRAFT_130164 [Trichoderma barbatum]